MVQHAQPANHVVQMSQRLGECSTAPVLPRHRSLVPPRLLAQMENLLPIPSRPAQIMQLIGENLQQCGAHGL